HHPRLYACPRRAEEQGAAAGTLVVDPLTAKRLRLSAGASVRAVPLSAQKRA
ncbi:arginine N-succinyltransferase, partial [Pseudomonas aeruginosa]|nr:arginine N-succinyltransferase [Pseudomonas aeruginosa]